MDAAVDWLRADTPMALVPHCPASLRCAQAGSCQNAVESSTPYLPAPPPPRSTPRRASYTPRYIKPPPKARSGQESYWDRVSLDAPNPLSLLPDKWYVRVAFLVVVLGVTVYLNMVAAGAK